MAISSAYTLDLLRAQLRPMSRGFRRASFLLEPEGVEASKLVRVSGVPGDTDGAHSSAENWLLAEGDGFSIAHAIQIRNLDALRGQPFPASESALEQIEAELRQALERIQTLRRGGA